MVKNHAGEATLSLVSGNIIMSSLEDLRRSSFGTFTVGMEVFDIPVVYNKTFCDGFYFSTDRLASHFLTRIMEYLVFEHQTIQRLCYCWKTPTFTAGLLRSRLGSHEASCRCCQIHKMKRYGNITRCNQELHSLNPFIRIIKIVTSFVILFVLAMILTRIIEHSKDEEQLMTYNTEQIIENGVENTQVFTKVTESPLAPSTLMGKLIWKEIGPTTSFCRRLTFCFGFLLPIMLHFYKQSDLMKHSYFKFTFIPFSLTFVVSTFAVLCEKQRMDAGSRVFSLLFQAYLCISRSPINTPNESDISNSYEALIAIISSPFNFKMWKSIVRDCNRMMTCSSSRIGTIAGNITTCLICILIIPVYFIVLCTVVSCYVYILAVYQQTRYTCRLFLELYGL